MKYYVLFLILLVFKPSARGQPHDTLKVNHHYLFQIVKDAGQLAIAPVRWQKKDWIKFVAASGITAATLTLDDVVTDFARDQRGDFSNTVADFFEPLGRGEALMPWAPVVVWYLAGAVSHNLYQKQTALIAFESFLITSFFTQVLKKTIDRSRPFTEVGESFPSGHTSSIFSVVTVFSMAYSENRWVPPVLFTAATLTGLSRVNDLKHWLSDVFFGFVMGYSIGKTLTEWHINKDQRLTVSPAFSNNSGLILIKYQLGR